MRLSNLIFLAISILLCLGSNAGAACPVPPVKTHPDVKAQVEFDKKTNLYKYSYTVTNQKDSPLPIESFILQIDSQISEVQKPLKWHGRLKNNDTIMPIHLMWDTIKNYIVPNQTLSGFSFKSSRPPGIVKYFVEGHTGILESTPVNGDPEAFPDCPGFFTDSPRFESMTTGITEGPAPISQVSVKLKLKNEKEDHDLDEVSPYEDKNKMTVILNGENNFDVATILIPSIRFGMGKAPVVFSKIVNDDKENDRVKNKNKSKKSFTKI